LVAAVNTPVLSVGVEGSWVAPAVVGGVRLSAVLERPQPLQRDGVALADEQPKQAISRDCAELTVVTDEQLGPHRRI
jgi:hypothetical protein